MIPLAALREAGWTPNSTSGESRAGIRRGLVAWTRFQTPYGIWSGPGVEGSGDFGGRNGGGVWVVGRCVNVRRRTRGEEVGDEGSVELCRGVGVREVRSLGWHI